MIANEDITADGRFGADPDEIGYTCRKGHTSVSGWLGNDEDELLNFDDDEAALSEKDAE